MADAKISALTDGAVILPDDEVAINRSGTSYRARVPAGDGWIQAQETWTYASGSGGGTATFTVSGNVTAKYGVGTRIKLTQTTVKYFVVSADPTFAGGNTTVTITAGTVYTLANAAITSPYYSYDSIPQGYPDWFNYTPTYTGFSANPTVQVARFRVEGRACTVQYQDSGFGTSNSTGYTISAPMTAAAVPQLESMIIADDNGATLNSPGKARIVSGGTSFTILKDLAGNGFTASGGKAILAMTFTYRV